jgi:hypothetical protein
MTENFDFISEVISLDTVPEAYKPLYQPTEDGTKFVLDPIIAKKLDVSPLKNALASERKLREEFQKKAKVADKLDSLGINPDELENYISGNKQGKKASEDEGEKIRKQIADQYGKEIETYKNTNQKLTSRLQASVVEDVAIRALVEEKGSVDLLLPHIKSMVKVEFDEEYNPVVKVYDRDGQPLVGRDGNYFTVKDLVKYLKTQDVFARAFEGEGRSGGGTPPRNGAGGTSIKNPWSKEGMNLSEQGRLLKENPALAERLKKEAGNS